MSRVPPWKAVCKRCGEERGKHNDRAPHQYLPRGCRGYVPPRGKRVAAITADDRHRTLKILRHNMTRDISKEGFKLRFGR